MVIKNIGMLWERKFIHWGAGRNKGNLIGANSRVEQADFRAQIGIYILHDKNMDSVYVGQTGTGKQRLFDRLKQHTKDHLWNRWDYFSWFGLCSVNKTGDLSAFDKPDRKYTIEVSDVLNQLEGVLISLLEPPLNKQGPRWGNVEEFYQEVVEEVEETTMECLYEKMVEFEKQLKRLG